MGGEVLFCYYYYYCCDNNKYYFLHFVYGRYEVQALVTIGTVARKEELPVILR